MPTPEIRSRYEVIIVGGGFAGAATAWALAVNGVRDVLLLEQERVCGVHSSGRNAGMVRTAVEDPLIAVLAREGCATMTQLAASTAAVRFDRCGSLLLGASAIPAEVVSAGSHERVSAEFAVERVPLLAGGVVEDVLYSPADGLVEVDGLLQWFLARARDGGATIATGLGPARPHVVRDRVEGVILQHDRVSTRHLVVAAGGWSSDWGAMANIPIELEPRRRHIVCTEEPPESRSKGWPWVWDVSAGFYFRPESSGLLWSPCDELVDRPGEATADPEAAVWLAEKITPRVPRAKLLRKTRSWAGHRTFAPDSRFLLGPDPRIDGWHWAAGLGGHGVTVASAVGRRVARGITGEGEIEAGLRFRPSVVGRKAS